MARTSKKPLNSRPSTLRPGGGGAATPASSTPTPKLRPPNVVRVPSGGKPSRSVVTKHGGTGRQRPLRVRRSGRGRPRCRGSGRIKGVRKPVTTSGQCARQTIGTRIVLDEVGKRTDAYDEPNSVHIVLPDGQAWAFVKPWLQFRPKFEGGHAKRAEQVVTYSNDSDDLIEAIADGRIEPFSGAASLASWLLRRSYHLTEDELDQLLGFRPDDAASIMWAVRVMQVATGMFGVAKLTLEE